MRNQSDNVRSLDPQPQSMQVANILGFDAAEFDATKFSGISFRKFALSELAKHVQPTILAAHGEHKSVETTNAYYVTQSIDQRASHTALISSGLVK